SRPTASSTAGAWKTSGSTSDDGRTMIVRREILRVARICRSAFVVVDAYQGRGIGRVLMRHLSNIARAAGLRALIAEVLPENIPMLQLFKTSGLELGTRREGQVVHVTISLS